MGRSYRIILPSQVVSSGMRNQLLRGEISQQIDKQVIIGTFTWVQEFCYTSTHKQVEFITSGAIA